VQSFVRSGLVSVLMLPGILFYGHCFAGGAVLTSEHMVETSRGVIFSENISAEVGVCKSLRDCWTPSSGDIENMEKELSMFLKKSKVMGSSEIFENLATYKRKYYGSIRGGIRYIHVNGLCHKYWKPSSSKFSSPTRLMTDMGPCYFLVDYNVERRRFSNYYVDGD
jgi:hypothetical protein